MNSILRTPTLIPTLRTDTFPSEAAVDVDLNPTHAPNTPFTSAHGFLIGFGLVLPKPGPWTRFARFLTTSATIVLGHGFVWYGFCWNCSLLLIFGRRWRAGPYEEPESNHPVVFAAGRSCQLQGDRC